MRYQVRIKGHLNNLIACFGGFEIVSIENGDTLLMGSITDQAALYGLLETIRGLGITLISVMPLDLEE